MYALFSKFYCSYHISQLWQQKPLQSIIRQQFLIVANLLVATCQSFVPYSIQLHNIIIDVFGIAFALSIIIFIILHKQHSYNNSTTKHVYTMLHTINMYNR